MINIVLVGQPNCGKTSIFNKLTRSNQHVGNWPGVTVEKKEGFLQIDKQLNENYEILKNEKSKILNETIKIIDLPGIYSLTSLTAEEKVTRDFLLNGNIDLVINILDGNNIQRNLFLTFQILLLNIPTIIVVNFIDELKIKNLSIDYEKFSKMLNTKVILTNAREGEGIDKIFEEIFNFIIKRKKINERRIINYDKNLKILNQEIKKDTNNKENYENYKIIEIPDLYKISIPIENSEIKNLIEEISNVLYNKLDEKYKKFTPFFSLKFLENDDEINCYLNKNLDKEVLNKLKELKNNFLKKFQTDDFIHVWIYGITSGIEKEVIIPTKTKKNKKDKINILFIQKSIDKILLNKYFGILFLFTVMFLIFSLTFTIGNFFVNLFENIINYIVIFFDNLINNSMIKSLIIDGIIGGIGNIILLLPYIFIMFLLFGILEDTGYIPRASFVVDKFMHKLGLHGKSFIPLILGFGCNVPAIMGTRILEKKEERIKTILMIPLISCSGRLPIYIIFTSIFFKKYQGLVIFSLYFIGIIISIITGILLNKTKLKDSSEGLIMELPPYRVPQLKNLWFYTLPKVKDFLKKAGTLIFLFSLIYWFLSYFPNPEYFGTEKSFAGKISLFINPIFKPLNFDWKLSLSLLTGFFAKELVVSNLGVLYSKEGTLINVLPKYYSPIISYGFLLFVSLYIPCIATISVIKQETKSIFWTLFSIIYPLAIAWIVSFVFIKLAFLFL